MIGNISLAIAWFFMYCATTMWDVFIGNILLGLGAGLIQTAAITYVAEVRYVFFGHYEKNSDFSKRNLTDMKLRFESYEFQN